MVPTAAGTMSAIRHQWHIASAATPLARGGLQHLNTITEHHNVAEAASMYMGDLHRAAAAC